MLWLYGLYGVGTVKGAEISVNYFGMEIFITELITKDIQRRKHKKRRINKKWLKRYGYKCVPDNDKIIVFNNKLFMTKGAYERVKKELRLLM